MEAGTAIAGRAPVTAIDRERRGFVVTTARGKIQARNVLVATNGYTGSVTTQFRARLLPFPSVDSPNHNKGLVCGY